MKKILKGKPTPIGQARVYATDSTSSRVKLAFTYRGLKQDPRWFNIGDIFSTDEERWEILEIFAVSADMFGEIAAKVRRV